MHNQVQFMQGGSVKISEQKVTAQKPCDAVVMYDTALHFVGDGHIHSLMQQEEQSKTPIYAVAAVAMISIACAYIFMGKRKQEVEVDHYPRSDLTERLMI